MARHRAKEWGIDPGALGIVLSMELIGMAIGSASIGGVADKIGRRPTILGCLVLMAFGMVMVTTVHSVVELSIWRVITGLGIGGMLAAINAVAAEFLELTPPSPERVAHVDWLSARRRVWRDGRRRLLRSGDWRPVFYFGAADDGAHSDHVRLRARIDLTGSRGSSRPARSRKSTARSRGWDVRRLRLFLT
jgi:hypothetical protein